MHLRLQLALLACVCFPELLAKPSNEQLKLVGQEIRKKQRYERLDRAYHCEACRVVMEEVEFQLEQLKEKASRKKQLDKPIDPGDMLDKLCEFGSKRQPISNVMVLSV